MKNTGTLIGAPIRPNDSADQYAVAFQNEIKGGHHSRTTTAERDAIGDYLREAGMTCYVQADGNTYKLQNDLVTWELDKQDSGNSEEPGSGGNAPTVQLISGNFGEWTPVGSPSAQMVSAAFPLSYKGDLLAFPTRAIVHLQGQFSLDTGFAGTIITLGTLPVNYRPASLLRKYFIVQNIELYLLIETGGAVKLVSKDGFNLPVEVSGEPYYLDCFFKPLIGEYVPTVYNAHRTGDFTRNNCGSGYAGSTISFSKTYTSTVSQATADAIADSSFQADGQAYANNPANGATCTLSPVCSLSLEATADPDGGITVTGNISQALDNRLNIAFATSYVQNGATMVGPGGTLRIQAGDLQDYLRVYSYNPAAGEISGLVATITLVSPNPNGGITVNY